RPRFGRTAAAAAAVVVFAAGALGGRLLAGGPAPECFDGTLRLLGSTAFERTAEALRADYEALCGAATVEVDATGSNEGVRALTAKGAGSTIAMHDGHLRPDSDEVGLRGFQGFPVSLLAYAVIVNKDTGVTDLPVQTLRAIYAGADGPADWKRVRGGASLPIRLVSRTEGSGTRTIFEERVLQGAEPGLSSRDCLRKDDLRAAARIVRCERSSQGQVLDLVDRTPGAIGYAELHLAADTARYPGVRVIALDGRRPGTAPGEYPFNAPEVFYTYGFPANGTPVSAFLTYLSGPRARALLTRVGSPPCLAPTPPLAALCRSR
ncbi:substrate-binding domain-containing protein, partial [Actinocorallia longicatena]|uniref:substrate-binding domain-containing protein n=1 Tax=Actinocorallia longicatena TaxID=111803 RepID=UPI0031D592A2